MCMRVNISIDDGLLNEFDAWCSRYHFTRSEFITALMRATVYEDFTLKGARTIVRTVQGSKEVKPQEDIPIKNETPKNLEYDVSLGKLPPFETATKSNVTAPIIKRELVWENRSSDQIEAQTKIGWCGAKVEYGVNQKVYLISSEDAEGKLKYDKVWFCENCLDALRSKIDNEGGVIIGS